MFHNALRILPVLMATGEVRVESVESQLYCSIWMRLAGHVWANERGFDLCCLFINVSCDLRHRKRDTKTAVKERVKQNTIISKSWPHSNRILSHSRLVSCVQTEECRPRQREVSVRAKQRIDSSLDHGTIPEASANPPTWTPAMSPCRHLVGFVQPLFKAPPPDITRFLLWYK